VQAGVAALSNACPNRLKVLQFAPFSLLSHHPFVVPNVDAPTV